MLLSYVFLKTRCMGSLWHWLCSLYFYCRQWHFWFVNHVYLYISAPLENAAAPVRSTNSSHCLAGKGGSECQGKCLMKLGTSPPAAPPWRGQRVQDEWRNKGNVEQGALWGLLRLILLPEENRERKRIINGAPAQAALERDFSPVGCSPKPSQIDVQDRLCQAGEVDVHIF